MIRRLKTTFAAAALVCTTAVTVQAAIIGNDVTVFDRGQPGDGSKVFHTNHIGMPNDGFVDAVLVSYQGGSGTNQTFSLIQLRPTGVDHEYTLVNMSDVFDLTGFTAGELAVLSLDAPWAVEVGDIFGFYGSGIAFETVETDWPLNRQPTYHESGGLIWTHSVGDTLSLGNLPALPSPTFDRDYGYAVSFIPEPVSLALLGLGALAMLRRRS